MVIFNMYGSYYYDCYFGAQTTKHSQTHSILSRTNLTGFNIGLAESPHIINAVANGAMRQFIHS